jgi:hypothetical protein
MVVTGGRKDALEHYQAIRHYADKAWPGLGVLVAFSGTLEDPDTGAEWTEAQLNGFPETRLPEMFGYVKADDPQAAARNRDEYRLLVVAEKYQTGFDQPLLCGMYVDKKLDGVAAGADAVAAQPHPPAQVPGRRAGARLRQLRGVDGGVVQALVRADDHRRGRPEHPLPHAAGGHAVRGGGGAGDGGLRDGGG